MSPETLMEIGKGIAYVLAGLGAAFGIPRGVRAIQAKRNGYSNGLTTALARHIDERAEHKANGAVARVTLDVSILRRDMDEFKADTGRRLDTLQDDVGEIGEGVAFLKGKLEQ